MGIPNIVPYFFAYECKLNEQVFCTLCHSSGIRFNSHMFILYRIDGFDGLFCPDCVKLIFRCNNKKE